MFNKSKKFIAVILTLVSLFSICAIGVSAADEVKKPEYPVIYLTGYGQQIFTEKHNHKSELLYPTGVDVAARVEQNLTPILLELAMASATGDYTAYCDAVYESIGPIYDKLRLNPDGTVKDNSGTWKNSYAVHYNVYEPGAVHFSYDWRLSPLTIADELAECIDIVLGKYNAEKVHLVGRCLGGNVINSYLELYAEEAEQKVAKTVLYMPSTMGIGLIGAIFSGEIELNAANLETYIDEMMDYADIMEDGLAKDFVTVLISAFEQAEILNFGVEQLDKILDEIKDNIIPRLVRDSYGSFPSFWAMVPDEYLEKAIGFVYNTDELKEEYTGTISLVREYNETVQKNAFATVSADEELYVISKYNLPSAPVFGKSNPTGDAIAEACYSSFGATCADFGSRLGSEYISAMDEEALKYLSLDEKIDASTCAAPDRTWFIKNNYHDHFPATVDYFINTLLVEDMTVFTNPELPQYLDADVTAETLTPVSEPDQDLPKPGSKEDKYALLFEFIKFAIELLIELIQYVSTQV